MNKRVRWITETAVLLAMLLVLQYVTKMLVPMPAGQFVTGSCVNAVLAVAALFAGMSSGVTIALISPVFAFMLQIAPQGIVVPAIMVGNVVFVMLLNVLYGQKTWKQVTAWLVASVAKFASLYILVVKLIIPAFVTVGAQEKVVNNLTAMFSWPQLVTALIGGALALAIAPVLKKALHR